VYVSVICGTAAGGFTFAFVLRIAKVFTNWSDTSLMPDIVGTPFLLEALRRDPAPILLSFPYHGRASQFLTLCQSGERPERFNQQWRL